MFTFNSLKSFLFVLLQFIFIGIIVITDKIIPCNIFLLIIFSLSLILGLYAMLIMKFNFNVAPDLKPGAIFIYKGPYKFIRHPMYTSVLLSALCLVINDFSIFRFAVFISLVIVLLLKMLYEEKILIEKFEGYSEYMRSTKRLIPFIF